jgi:hypothetical protein
MAKTTTHPPSHRWHFYRAGGVDQVRIDSGADILNLDQLDQRLWVALSCPTEGVELDERTLKVLDQDGDGHVRPPEILAVVKWLGEVIRKPDALLEGRDGVPLENIRTDTAEGRKVLAAAKHILNTQGVESLNITTDDALQAIKTLIHATHNGDGVVPPDTVEGEVAQVVAAEIVECLGGVDDRSGKPGFDQEKLDVFFAACETFDIWWKIGESEGTAVLPLGENTIAAVEALDAVKAKVDDFFGRARLAAFDSRALGVINRQENAFLEVAAKDLSIDASEIAHFPLALVEPNKPLPLTDGVNPAWSMAVGKLRDLCVKPLLGKSKDSITDKDWGDLQGKFVGYRDWVAGKAGGDVEELGVQRIREILAGNAHQRLQKAILDDLAVSDEVAALSSVDKLTLLYRDIAEVLNNFVSFSNFYARKTAIFQAGTLHLDGRTADLCVEVTDLAQHAKLAAMSKVYLVYCTCTSQGGAQKVIAAAITSGNSDNIFVGRNGIFYDRKGQDWHATITKIIDHPISVRQAFWAPYKKVLRFIEESIAKHAAAADAATTSKLQKSALETGEAAVKGEAQKPKFEVGTIAALGVAVGGITAALSAILAAFFGLGIWIPVGMLGLLLAISGPSMLIAWLKLRQRNLGPILDAGGWAVNTLTKVNIPLGTALTERAVLPKNSYRTLVDPYAPKKPWWPKILFLLVVSAGIGYGLYRFEYLNKWFPKYIPAYPTVEEKSPAETTDPVKGEDNK